MRLPFRLNFALEKPHRDGREGKDARETNIQKEKKGRDRERGMKAVFFRFDRIYMVHPFYLRLREIKTVLALADCRLMESSELLVALR